MDAYEIDLHPNAIPGHARAYPIPQVHTATLKMKVDRLVKPAVLQQVNHSEWAAPTLITKEGWFSPIYIRLLQIKQKNQMQTITHSQNTKHVAQTRGFPICT